MRKTEYHAGMECKCVNTMSPEFKLPAHSSQYGRYFTELTERVREIYAIAEKARAEGLDPVERVEIPHAHDVAARVEATLEGPVGVASRIRELQATMSREGVAFKVAEEIARGELGGMEDPEKAADKAVRVALAILTESITAAPLEGIARVRIRGSGLAKYLALYLAGPIRAAGGTESAVTVLVADHVRQALGLPALESTQEEIDRVAEEVELYRRNAHLQYSDVPSELIKFAAKHLPIMLTGEPTEEYEVSGGRDLDRIETNRVRGGMVLVLNDGVVGRAAKLARIVDKLGIEGWDWLNEIARRLGKAKEASGRAEDKTAPKEGYLADVIAGRPVFAHPSRREGFRLRYGRARNTGLAGVGIHPATMHLLDEFLATGTHIRTERPGKGSIVAPVDTIEGPVVLLRGGSVVRVDTLDEARRIAGRVERILYLGDILVAVGEFRENNHPLVPAGYCEEWWAHDLEVALVRLSDEKMHELVTEAGVAPDRLHELIRHPLSVLPTPEEAVGLSTVLGIPLHPRYLYRWTALGRDEACSLRTWILEHGRLEEANGQRRVVLPYDKDFKRLLERAGVPHTVQERGSEILLTDDATTVLAQLGSPDAEPRGDTALEALNSVSEVVLRDRIGTTIGARMGRPEKAEARKMRPPVHVLFPVGRKMSNERRLERVAGSRLAVATLEDGNVLTDSTAKLEMVSRVCPKCGAVTFESKCPNCRNVHTEIQPWCSQEGCGAPVDPDSGMCRQGHDINLVRTTREYSVDMGALLDRVKQEIDEPQAYGVKGVLGLTSVHKIPEYLGKGILRAKHAVYCYRDGTARFDVTDAPLTHFRPCEVGVSVERLHALGYHSDYKGRPLVSEEQIVELKVQDIVIPENGAEYLLRVGRFVDDCLRSIYKQEAFYKFETREDLIGQLVVGLAPHTSAGIIGRIVGFTRAKVCYAHPFWHAAKRRNCDGDEDAIILVLDALLNFSRSYLPAGRGGFMDAPLVLSVILNPQEVDDESHNIEVCAKYPAEVYSAATRALPPREIEDVIDSVSARLGTEAQYEGFAFTHGTTRIDMGPRETKYKVLGSMQEKLGAQLHVAELVDAVDTLDVAQRVVSHHFFRDIRGNLRAFSTQRFQCPKCRRVMRRMPLSGKCVCGSDLILTVSQKSVSKYLGVAEAIIQKYGLDRYLEQRLQLIKNVIGSLFVSSQTTLTEFMDGGDVRSR